MARRAAHIRAIERLSVPAASGGTGPRTTAGEAAQAALGVAEGDCAVRVTDLEPETLGSRAAGGTASLQPALLRPKSIAATRADEMLGGAGSVGASIEPAVRSASGAWAAVIDGRRDDGRRLARRGVEGAPASGTGLGCASESSPLANGGNAAVTRFLRYERGSDHLGRVAGLCVRKADVLASAAR